jgi:hypothetical protein
MGAWPALLIAPLVVLAQQSISLALATPSCHQQTTVALNVVAAAALLLVLLLTALAATGWQAHRLPGDRPLHEAECDDTRALRRRRFVAALGTATGLLSALVSLAMWFPVWALSPCAS